MGYAGEGMVDGGEKFESGGKGIDWLVMWGWVVSVWEVRGTSGLG